MGILKWESVTCPIDQHCIQWARRYLGLCLCSKSNGLSGGMGFISVISWCVAEIPQIITNFKKKSAEGLSFAFLMTWIVGDAFNLIGCKLEPETLPTQYYTAVLYMVTTLSLAGQALYYNHIYPRTKSDKRQQETGQEEAVERREHNDLDTERGNIHRWGAATSSTVPDASSSSSRYDELYFMSARSLSVSRTCPAVPFIGSISPVLDIERRWFNEPLLGEGRSPRSGTPKIKTMLCVVSLMTFLVGGHHHLRSETLENNFISRNPRGDIVFQVGRQLLEENVEVARNSAQQNMTADHRWIASILGWGMTVIYLGGRLPQIYLNIKRGHTEGLNALMFIFAIVGNTTYLASILLNSLDWLKIKPNLPWLVDAGGCVILDAFILIQFVYYRHPSRASFRRSSLNSRTSI